MQRAFARTLLVGGGITYVSSYLTGNNQKQRLSYRGSALCASSEETSRLRATEADRHFQRYKHIPKPREIHSIVPRRERGKGILVIGDVHGCYSELLLLHEAAVKENGNDEFQYVVLVGDLVNKGPESISVIRHVRATPNWLSVRGNHDDGALAAMLDDQVQSTKVKYKWIFEAEQAHPQDDGYKSISDDDVQWMADLPYTLRLEGSMLNEENDTLIVHAGLIPGVSLNDQATETMVTIRDVQPVHYSNNDQVTYHMKNRCLGNDGAVAGPTVNWTTVWSGPEHVIFGHDAKRGLQLRERTTGLDTGCCYGKELTGIMLPERKLVSVKALALHSPIVD